VGHENKRLSLHRSPVEDGRRGGPQARCLGFGRPFQKVVTEAGALSRLCNTPKGRWGSEARG